MWGPNSTHGSDWYLIGTLLLLEPSEVKPSQSGSREPLFVR